MARSLAMYHGIPLRARRLERFYAPIVAPGTLCFDIGAHAGNRVRCFRALGARVVAVEPQPDFAGVLRVLFGRDRAVTIVEAALGQSAGAATLHVSRRTPTVSSLSLDWIRRVQHDPSFRDVVWAAGPTVPVTTLDALIGEHGVPQFTKIDVEGSEHEVLSGLSVALPALSFEYLPATADLAIACINRLTALGAYEFNVARGETHRWLWNEWRDAGDAHTYISAISSAAGSGDIYARLGRSGYGRR